MTIESEQDLDSLRRIGGIVARVLRRMLAALEPGMTTRELDRLGRAWLEAEGARPAPELTYGFPGATCISINEEAAHGVPGERVIEAGDVVNVDVSAERHGYFADTGGSRVVAPVDPAMTQLCRATASALKAAMREARHGAPLNRIGWAIERVARSQGFRTIRNLASHGVGRALHEEPESIFGHYEPRDRRRLERGMVITIEPFLSTRSRYVSEAADGWTLVGQPGNRSAQYEHTLVITDDAPLVMTRP